MFYVVIINCLRQMQNNLKYKIAAKKIKVSVLHNFFLIDSYSASSVDLKYASLLHFFLFLSLRFICMLLKHDL